MYLYSDVLIAVYVRCQVPRRSILPYMKTVIYSYLTKIYSMVAVTRLRPSIHNYYNHWQCRAIHGQGFVLKFVSSTYNND